MQATTIEWAPPRGTLGELVAAAGSRAERLRTHVPRLEREVAAATRPPAFEAALRRADVALIAELKRRSPSKGVLDDSLSAPERSAAYASGGASAISVLTEPERFGGSLEDLVAVRTAVSVPVLRKDFIVDRAQLLEARAAGASAVLLISRALAPARFAELAREARAIGLELLLEVRDQGELDRALALDAGVIGVNNRNLETLEVDDRVSARLLPLIPRARTAVFESGLGDRAGVEGAAALGADAVLVGSALSRSPDPVAAARALTGVRRVPRG